MDLQQRLARLERAARWQRALLAVAVLAGAAAWAHRPVRAVDTPAPDAALAMAIKNPAGTVVATVRSTDDGSSFTLCDAAGKPKLLLAVTKDGPGLYLLDGKEGGGSKGVRLAIAASQANGPSLALFNGVHAQPAAAMRLKADGATGQFIATDGQDRRFVFPHGDSAEEKQ